MAVMQATTNAESEQGAKGPENACLSLRMLAEKANASDGGAAATCYGLNYVKGYVIDEANHDIVLYGNNIESSPPLLFDDLCVCVQNIWNTERFNYLGHQYPYPFCSLDPQKGAMASVNLVMQGVDIERLEEDSERKRMSHRLAEALGPQEVRVGGIPRDVRIAHVMIDADYHMKKVSQGHLSLSGVQSCAQIGLKSQMQPQGLFASLCRLLGIGRSQKGSRMSRFWFHLDKNHPTFIQSTGIVEIENCSMVILTERQVSAHDGSLMDGGGDYPDAQAFAESLSTQLRRNAAGVTEYMDLENLYRLFALLKAIQFASAETIVGLELSPLLNHQPQRIYMPDALPALANIETETEETPQAKRWYSSLVCGGVSVDVSLTPARFNISHNGLIAKTKQMIMRSRPHGNAVFWTYCPIA